MRVPRRRSPGRGPPLLGLGVGPASSSSPSQDEERGERKVVGATLTSSLFMRSSSTSRRSSSSVSYSSAVRRRMRSVGEGLQRDDPAPVEGRRAVALDVEHGRHLLPAGWGRRPRCARRGRGERSPPRPRPRRRSAARAAPPRPGPPAWRPGPPSSRGARPAAAPTRKKSSSGTSIATRQDAGPRDPGGRRLQDAVAREHGRGLAQHRVDEGELPRCARARRRSHEFAIAIDSCPAKRVKYSRSSSANGGEPGRGSR